MGNHSKLNFSSLETSGKHPCYFLVTANTWTHGPKWNPAIFVVHTSANIAFVTTKLVNWAMRRGIKARTKDSFISLQIQVGHLSQACPSQGLKLTKQCISCALILYRSKNFPIIFLHFWNAPRIIRVKASYVGAVAMDEAKEKKVSASLEKDVSC